MFKQLLEYLGTISDNFIKLDKKIGFLDIGTLVSRCLESTEYKEINDLSDVLEADMFAREFVRENYDKL